MVYEPPMAWYQGIDIWITTNARLYLRQWPEKGVGGWIADDSRAVMAETMLMLFWGPFFIYFGQFSDGMSYAGGNEIMNNFSNAYPNFNDLFHGQKYEERHGFIFYDNFNNPAISIANNTFYAEHTMTKLKKYREQCANMAWYKVFRESNEGRYFQDFNNLLYYYGWSFSNSQKYGYLYRDPTFDKLSKMAEEHGQL